MDSKITGKIINEKRKEKGLTQLQLSQLLNVSNRTISKWENGDGFPDITLLPDISKELDVTIDELLTGVKPDPIIEIREIETETNSTDYKKVKAKFLISEIIAFCLSIGANIIGGITEIMFFNLRPFYAFIEIYLLVATVILFIVAIIIFLTGFVKFKIDTDKVGADILTQIYLFIIITSVTPILIGYRMLAWCDCNIRFLVICIIAFIAFSSIMFKKIRSAKNES